MTDLDATYHELKKIMAPYAAKLDTKISSDNELHVDTRHMQKNKKPLFFGAVKVGKKYVSYHLMPIYVHPPLLAPASAELKKRMQGKSCFNFTAVDKSLFQELAKLTEAGFAHYREQGFV